MLASKNKVLRKHSRQILTKRKYMGQLGIHIKK